MIELDGSLGEGGGQILRSALALSLVTQQPFTVKNIRAKRPKPGLMRQHLVCVQAAAAVCGLDVAQVSGAALGSSALTFVPQAVKAGQYTFKIGSAGSCMLVLQTVLWPLLLADHLSQLRLEGGTHNPMAPSASYLQWTLPQVLAQTGGTVALTLERHGFYPAGGGAVSVHITPTDALQALCFLERGALTAAHAVCLHAAMPTGVAQRELATVGQLLGWLPEQLHDRALRQNEGPGNALLAVLQYEHFTEVFAEYGQRSVSAEQVAKHLVKQVRQYQTNAAPVGEYTADQLMLPLALACAAGHTSAGYVATNISKHATTHAAVIEAFLPVKFDLQMRAGNARFCVNHLQQTERE